MMKYKNDLKKNIQGMEQALAGLGIYRRPKLNLLEKSMEWNATAQQQSVRFRKNGRVLSKKKPQIWGKYMK